MNKIFNLLFLLMICPSIEAQWQYFGGAPGGGHYTPLTEINSKNINQLHMAWTYHTGDFNDGKNGLSPTTFEATPIFFNKTLYFCTPYEKIIALDPETGTQKWQYDSHLDKGAMPVEGVFTCRGVAAYITKNTPDTAVCSKRIIASTVDGRLLAIDANTGKLCTSFGKNGTVDFSHGVSAPFPLSDDQVAKLQVPQSLLTAVKKFQKYQGGSTSGPLVINDEIIIGQAMDDNVFEHMPAGVVQAFSAISGKLLWEFNTIPTNMREKTGAANVWGPIAADIKHNIIYVATSSPSADIYGGNRLQSIPYANAVIALNAKTGQPIWHYQIVHHDLFDYDLAAQPTLVDISHNGQQIPALIQATKMGTIFTFNRYTGTPIFPIIEKSVPQSTLPGEQSAPTQPFPVLPEPLISETLNAGTMWGITPLDRAACQRTLAQYDSKGLFTPPSTRGWVEFPFTGGGINWGGVAYDPTTNLLIVNYSRIAHLIKIIPRKDYNMSLQKDGALQPVFGGPYAVIERKLFLSPLGLPCNAPPWGGLAAIDMNTGKIRWQQPFGSVEKFGLNSPKKWGAPNTGGAMVTGSGLIFIGASLDGKFHAYNTMTGQLLWETKLPSVAAAIPMSYEINGKQYILIAAGGGLGSSPKMIGDSIVAFALDEKKVAQ